MSDLWLSPISTGVSLEGLVGVPMNSSGQLSGVWNGPQIGRSGDDAGCWGAISAVWEACGDSVWRGRGSHRGRSKCSFLLVMEALRGHRRR